MGNYHFAKNKHHHLIEVVGEGSITTMPNQAQVILGVITESKNVSDAQEQNTSITTSIIQALHQLGITSENIQTVGYQINPQYNYEDGKQILLGYRVQHQLKVTVVDFNKIGAVIDTSVHHGANSVSSITFTVAHPELYYNQALQVALKNGGQKANTIAQTIGLAPYPVPFQVIELSHMPYPTQENAVLYKQAVTPIEPGRLQITATVRMKFRFYTP